ncbi:adenosylcobinamide-phosphate synthase CbiB [Altericista sp. CCNU0014]|uniref:adenosylcobinamide-phosphate synthase CbiB n=1 Tax=Altericista sp. CCNU0014 TaxID=3082949 RepID=UPI00384BA7A8
MEPSIATGIDLKPVSIDIAGLFAAVKPLANVQAVLLICAAFLDFILGDPWGWPHPVRVMGAAIQYFCNWSWRWFKRPLALRLAGIVLALGLVLGSALAARSIVDIAYQVWTPAGWGVEVILLASCFAGRSLRTAAEDVLKALKTDSIEEARAVLSRYVGRDTAELSESEILRAILETVAENATDGVMAPLFYALLGLAWPVVGMVPLAIAYKAASTLDSMVGYRHEPYIHIGWFSAKLDDVLTWLPCRLNVLTLGAISGKLQAVWQLCWRDAAKDPSPNSGWSECAYAAILDVQLGGLNSYQGVIKFKPLLGRPYRPITQERIEYALRLTRNCFVVWVAFSIAFSIAFSPSVQGMTEDLARRLLSFVPSA